MTVIIDVSSIFDLPISTRVLPNLLQCVMFSSFFKCKLHSVMSKKVHGFLQWLVFARKEFKITVTLIQFAVN